MANSLRKSSIISCIALSLPGPGLPSSFSLSSRESERRGVISRETERRKPKLAPEDEVFLLLLVVVLGVAAVRGEEIAGETLVAEIFGAPVDAAAATVVGVTPAVLALAGEVAGVELDIPYWRLNAANVSAVTLEDTVGVMVDVAAMEGLAAVAAEAAAAVEAAEYPLYALERMEAVKAETAPGVVAMLERFLEAAMEAARAAVVAVAVVAIPLTLCLFSEAAAAPM